MNVLQRLMCNPKLLRFAYTRTFASVASTLGLTQTLKNYHHRGVLQEGGVYRTSFFGKRVLFRTPTPGDLVHLEYHLALLESKTIQTLARSLRPGDIFLDVGADVGIFTVLSALLVGETGQVIALSPK